jgi:hypothetical protein
VPPPAVKAETITGTSDLEGHWRKPGIDYPCMIGDIEKTAGLTVYEPDDGVVQFAKWRPLDQNAPSRSAVSAPAREDPVAGRGE